MLGALYMELELGNENNGHIERLAALMCYVQLSLWNVPAQVVVGNSLTFETREVFYTPAHYMGAWDMRLNLKKSEDLITEH